MILFLMSRFRPLDPKAGQGGVYQGSAATVFAFRLGLMETAGRMGLYPLLDKMNV